MYVSGVRRESQAAFSHPQDWKSEKALYKADLDALPLNAKLHNNYAYYLDTEVRYCDAQRLLHPPFLSI
jgi:hypothetical protein